MKQNESQEISEKSPFLQKHSATIRIWHWLAFIIISFLIITVLFDSTMFNPWENAAMVKNVLKEKSAVVTDDQARAVAHEYSDKLWDLHKYLGFGLTFLFLARIVIEVTVSEEERIRTRIKNALLLFRQNSPNKKDFKHYLIVKYSYTLFYLLVMYMTVTGLLLAFGFNLGLSRETHHFVKDIHGFGQYVMYAFIFFHLCGVIIADLKHSKGIISSMVNGG
jgi:Ni,Fe-hydrogenase I cytochrome b subunit